MRALNFIKYLERTCKNHDEVIGILWTEEDVYAMAKKKKIELEDVDIKKIIANLESDCDNDIIEGITWTTIEKAIDSYLFLKSNA